LGLQCAHQHAEELGRLRLDVAGPLQPVLERLVVRASRRVQLVQERLPLLVHEDASVSTASSSSVSFNPTAGNNASNCETDLAEAIGATTPGCADSHAKATAGTGAARSEATASNAASTRSPRASRYSDAPEARGESTAGPPGRYFPVR